MVLTAHNTQYSDLKAATAAELAAGRLTQAQHDQIVQGIDQILEAAQAFDWTTILTVLGNIAPMIAMFIPGFQWVAAAIPLLTQIIQLIQTNGSSQQLIAALQNLISQIFGHLPIPIPSPIPGPTPTPVPVPVVPVGPTPMPNPTP